jgi:hypothetical protein
MVAQIQLKLNINFQIRIKFFIILTGYKIYKFYPILTIKFFLDDLPKPLLDIMVFGMLKLKMRP